MPAPRCGLADLPSLPLQSRATHLLSPQDYVKDDSCSSCRNDDNLDYGTMWQAIEVAGRPMVLTVEGDPDDSLITLGGYGNAKRVGHDISPLWMSMVSLVDIGSGLWPYAHNSTNSTVGGWWNDLDMVEVGNSASKTQKSTSDHRHHH
jgi:hypothetical protein